MRKILVVVLLVALLALPVLARANFPRIDPQPYITITSPAQGQIFNTNNISLEFTFTYFGNTDINMTFCKLDENSSCSPNYFDSIEMPGGANTFPQDMSYVWQIDPNGSPVSYRNLSDGWHTLWVTANNSYNGWPSYAGSVDVYINTQPMDLAITEPADGTHFAEPWVLLNFTTASADIDRFEYKVDTGNWLPAAIPYTGAGSYSLNYTSLPQGVRNLWLRAFDLEGNMVEDYATVVIDVDSNMPPSITISYPSNSSWHQSVSRIEFTATDDLSWTLYCEYYNGTWQPTDTNATSGILFNQTIAPMDMEGKETVKVRCFDGEKWSNNETHEFTIDHGGPSIQILEAPGRTDGYPFEYGNINASIMYTKNATIYYHATDPAGILRYEVQLDNNGWVDNGLNEQYEFNTADGNHTFRVHAVDTLNNIGGEDSVTAELDTVLLNSCYTFSPGLNYSNYSSNFISFQYWSNDNDKYHFEVRRDTQTTWIYKALNWSHGFDNLSPGFHYFYVRCFDVADNMEEAMVWANIAPVIRSNVTIDTPANDSNYTVDNILVQFHSDDLTIASFQYSYDDSEWFDTGINATTSTIYDWTFTDVQEGTSNLYVRGVSNSSHKGDSKSVTVNVESIFTNLHVEVWAPDTVISYTDFSVTIIVWNDNEELVPVGDVQVHLGLDYCSIPTWENDTRWMWELPGYGGSDYTTWTRVSCAMEIPHTINGSLIYLPTGQTKTDSTVVNAVPFSIPDPSPMEKGAPVVKQKEELNPLEVEPVEEKSAQRPEPANKVKKVPQVDEEPVKKKGGRLKAPMPYAGKISHVNEHIARL